MNWKNQMNEEEINNAFADIIETLGMEDVEEQVFEEVAFEGQIIDIEEVPAIVFMPVFTDYGMFYNSFPLSTKTIETFLAWFNSQE